MFITCLESSNWTNAENAAIGLGGHLATIDDLSENNWIWNRWGTNRSLWIGLHDPITGGGAEDFVWASGELAAYRNWRPGEPNGDKSAAYIYAKSLGTLGGSWNDIAKTQITPGGPEPALHGVVEVVSCSPHRARATATLANGFVVGAHLTDFGCGYTNTPAVMIEGGGGNGAMATATMMDGRVTQINITDAGCCYTNVPQIVIASPPMVPTVHISVSKVKVTQNGLVVGWKYVLESSHDLDHWVAAGPEFTAQSETMVNEFDVDLTGRFFRLRVVP